MLITLGILVGAIIGTVVDHEPYLGGALGGLAAWLLALQARLRRVEAELALVREPETKAAPGRRVSAPPQPGSTPPLADEARDPEIAARAQTEEAMRSATVAPPRPLGAAAPAVPPRRETPATPPRRPPAGPLLGERLYAMARDWLTTGNVPVKVGVVLSVFGLAFLIKEAVNRHWLVLPLELRLLAVALAGIAMLAVGWTLRNKNPVYALSVQGGGIAVLYLTTYASFGLYHLLPAFAAFALLLVITASAGVLAVLQDSRALAVLGIVGGFMAPVLVSTGAGNHVVLFSYYAILNGAILGIAWFKSWRELNLLGFGFTFVIGALWGYQGYRPEHFATTEPFLVLFVLIYTIVPILFAEQASGLKGFVDGTLVFGTPIVGFGLQTQLVTSEYGLAASAVVLAALYIGLATWMHGRRRDSLRVLTEAFIALGIVFLTLAVPLALDARWTSVAWALEGAALTWLGWRQSRKIPLVTGIALQALAAAAYAHAYVGTTPEVVFLNGHYFGGVLIALAAVFSSWVFERIERARHAEHVEHGAPPDPIELAKLASWVLLAWAAFWWGGVGFNEIDRAFSGGIEVGVTLGFLAVSTWLVMLVARGFAWERIASLGVLLVPFATFGLFASLLAERAPHANYGWLAWPVVLVTHFAFLARSERAPRGFEPFLHVLGFWLIAALATIEVHYGISRATDGAGVWADAGALACMAAVVLVTLIARERIAWPLQAQARAYIGAGCGGVLAVGGLALLMLNATSPGSAAPLPYVPVLNPLELASAFLLIVALRWHQAARIVPLAPRARLGGLVALGLFLLTMIVARTVHHWGGVPFEPERLAESNVFQAALSIVWGSTALIGMVAGARARQRAVWIGGAALMAAVVVKLFLVELGDTGTVTRVVSFLGVGVLLLIVGYFAPVPPRSGSPDETGGVLS